MRIHVELNDRETEALALALTASVVGYLGYKLWSKINKEDNYGMCLKSVYRYSVSICTINPSGHMTFSQRRLNVDATS